MKKIIKISIIIALIITILIPTFTFAASKVLDLGKGGSNLNQYKGNGESSKELQSKANNIASILSTIGIVVSVVALMAIGIKYMLGSVEEKAEYKKTLVPYIIGAFLVFTVSLVPQLIFNVMKNFK